MPVRSKRLSGPTVAGLAGATVYTTPSGETALIKTITIVNTTAGALIASIGIGGVAAGQQIVRKSVAGNDSLQIQCFIVLQPTETIQIAASAAAGITIALFGAELEGVAD